MDRKRGTPRLDAGGQEGGAGPVRVFAGRGSSRELAARVEPCGKGM